ncbi:MAG: hypothetical protein JXP34_14670 [Planctomycetes bacterium]|nr:hypothetical protein [Planctomycetota bacterium]
MREAVRKRTRKAAPEPVRPSDSCLWRRIAIPAGGVLLVAGIVWGLFGQAPADGASARAGAAPPANIASATGGSDASAFRRKNWSHLERGYAREVPVAPERRDIIRIVGEGAPEDLGSYFAGTTIVEAKGGRR